MFEVSTNKSTLLRNQNANARKFLVVLVIQILSGRTPKDRDKRRWGGGGKGGLGGSEGDAFVVFWGDSLRPTE